MSDAIVLENVTKTFGPKVAVHGMNLRVPQGALYGFIGPNGAGKTTSIRIILSILFADSGNVQVLGHKSALEAKDRIGYLPEERGVYKKMRVLDFLTYIAHLKGMRGADVPARVQEWLQRVGLPDVALKRCDELSKGMQQKIQFVGAVLHKPDLLVLDEPFSGLDPVSARQLRDLVLAEHERGATILFSTHVMTSAEQLCDHIVMIHGGEKVLDSSLAAIRNSREVNSLWFEPLDSKADDAVLRRVPGVAHVQRGAAWEIGLAPGAVPGEVLQAVAGAMPAARVELRRPTLEDVFVDIVSKRESTTAEQAARLREQLRNGAGGASA